MAAGCPKAPSKGPRPKVSMFCEGQAGSGVKTSFPVQVHMEESQNLTQENEYGIYYYRVTHMLRD